jgi:hypothetical protein
MGQIFFMAKLSHYLSKATEITDKPGKSKISIENSGKAEFDKLHIKFYSDAERDGFLSVFNQSLALLI